MTKNELKKLTKIATTNFYGLRNRADLTSHYCDDEDFVDAAVWEIQKALIEAYNLGRSASK